MTGNPGTYELALPSGAHTITADAVGAEGVSRATGGTSVTVTNRTPTLLTADVTATPLDGDDDVAVKG